MPPTVTCPMNRGRPPSGVYSTAQGSMLPRRARAFERRTRPAKVAASSSDSGGRLESHGRNHAAPRRRISAQARSSRTRTGRSRTGPSCRTTGQRPTATLSLAATRW